MPDSKSLAQWVAVEITLSTDMVDAICNFCHEQDAAGLVLDSVDQDTERVTAYFAAHLKESVSDRLRAYIAGLNDIFPDLPLPAVRFYPVEQEDWALKWKTHFKPQYVGRKFVVTPPWLDPQEPEKIVIIIEPAEAFGTGTHETTQGCLALLEEAVDRLKHAKSDLSMLDVGCGSGILAIAGAKLGVKPLLAVDNDPAAVEATRRNADLNGVGTELRVRLRSLEEINGAYDIVTANLDPLTLRENKDQLVSLFTHFLIISGVPKEQWDVLSKLFQLPGVFMDKEIIRLEWGCGLFTRKF
jgi:ribosomal protein L11 methyltransferase